MDTRTSGRPLTSVEDGHHMGGPGAPRDCHERTLTTTVISFGFSLQLSIRGEIHHGCDGAHLREEVLWVSGAAAI